MKIHPGSDSLPGWIFIVRLRVVRRIQPREEGIIRTAVEPFEREQHAHADVELARFVFGIGRAADVAAAALQLGAQLLLREAAGVAQTAQVVAKIAVPP